MLPMAIGPLSERLREFDLVVVIGAPVFRYYPYVAGDYLPNGTELLQITSDPNDAAAAAVGDSLLADAKLALESLAELVPQNEKRALPPPFYRKAAVPSSANGPLTAGEVFSALSEVRPDNAIIVQESPSNCGDLMLSWRTEKPESYYSYASGGLGWNAPAAVGIALAQEKNQTRRSVVAFIGDGALQYSVQCLYTAAQLRLNLVYIVPCNGEYAILKEFAALQDTPNCPALDLPSLDIASTARAFGCHGVEARTRDEIKTAFLVALSSDRPTVISVPISRDLRPLIQH
jgi:benzoylformate decarboxylase